MRKWILIFLFLSIILTYFIIPKLIQREKSIVIKDLRELEETSEEARNYEILNNIKNLCVLFDWSNRVIGGTLNGKWVKDLQIFETLNNFRFKVKFYELNKFLGEFEGIIPSSEDIYIEMSPPQKLVSINQIGISCNWDPLPRTPQIIENFKSNDLGIRKILKTDKDVNVRYKIVIDLDNDGNKEIIYEISNINEKDRENFVENSFNEIYKKNKYSLILLKDFEKDKEINYVLAFDYNSLNTNEIIFVADIDNDNIMEFGINCISSDAIPQEGFAVGTYKIFKKIKGTIKLIAEVFWIPRLEK